MNLSLNYDLKVSKILDVISKSILILLMMMTIIIILNQLIMATFDSLMCMFDIYFSLSHPCL